jgi:calcineurin-like phosphoesterase family protein
MKIFVIADTHFGHKTLSTEFQSRPPDFEAKIVWHWQRMVTNDDMIIHLGDVVVGNSNDWVSVIPELPGRKILVIGNHDKNTLSWYMTNGFDFCCQSFWWRIFGVNMLFSHEPTFDGQFDLNIHGHLHNGRHREYECDERQYLVSLEKANYQPRTLESIVKEWTKSNKTV